MFFYSFVFLFLIMTFQNCSVPAQYRKPPTISPGLIYFRKRFLMGLYKGCLYTGGLIHGRSFVLVINKSDISHKQENKHVLSSDYWAYINSGTYIRGAYIRVGLYSGGGGGGAYIWNEVSVSTCGGLIHRGGLYSSKPLTSTKHLGMLWAYTQGGGYIRGGGAYRYCNCQT